MTTADTLAVREQLVAVLRAADRPMTSAELAGVLPWQTHRLDVGCELVCQAPRRPAAMRVIECHRTWHLVSRPRSSQDSRTGIYRHLRALAREGIIRAIPLGPRKVQWTYVGDSRRSP